MVSVIVQPLRSFLFAPGKARASFGETAAGWSTIALPEPCRRAGLWPDPWATKPTSRLVCRIEQPSLISLLNAAKKQPGV